MYIIIDTTTNKIKQTIDKNYGIKTNKNELLQEVDNNFIEKFNTAQDYELIFKDEKVTDIKILKTWEEWQKEQPKIEPQPTKEERINAKILKDNAEIHLELEKQKQINAKLLLQVAELGGNK